MSEKFGEVDEGNIAELKQGDILFSYSHDTWTNEDVDVTLSLAEAVENKENYRIEYSKDNRTWTRYTEGSLITMTQNGKVYTRVKDITGDIKTEGGYAEGEVTIIDKKAPTPGSITMKMAALGTPYTEGEEVYQNVEIIVIDGKDEEDGSGHKSTTCTITGGRGEQDNQIGSIVLKASDNKYEVTVTTKDNAGNTSTSRAYIANPTYSKETKPMEVEGGTYYLPEGFKLAEDTAWKISDGIVIEDKQENEWVWIPCYVTGGTGSTLSGAIQYKKYLFKEQVFSTSDTSIVYFNQGNKTANDEWFSEKLLNTSNEYLSIYKYGGYYIGRYEAGKENDSSEEVLIQKDKVVYYPKNYEEVVKLSEEMTSLDLASNKLDGTKVFTKLCSSYSWDTAIKFIEKTNPNYGNTSKNKTGTLTGQYNNNIYGTGLLHTGKTLAVCNIYDMGGNGFEVTSEKYNRPGEPYVIRGGSYKFSSSTYTAGRRDCTNNSSSFAFRPTLFIK